MCLLTKPVYTTSQKLSLVVTTEVFLNQACVSPTDDADGGFGLLAFSVGTGCVWLREYEEMEMEDMV